MMAKKKEDLAQATVDELNNKLEDAHQELFNLRFQRATGQLKNPARMREVRKNIARIHTYLRQRELAGN
ncbi:MAG: 50S ribosomal protein L29 [Anaerolineales bacterium]|jgi:large subunit ribosomal protein L29|nr:50S ribosomal protein L29 [Anaerolineales bacterium]